MNGFDLSTITGLYVGSTEYSAIYKGSVKIWEATPPDYSLEYLTITSLEDDNDISITSSGGSYAPSNYIQTLYTIEYSTDKVNWTSKDTYRNASYYTPKIITLNRGQKLYLRSTMKSSDTYTTVQETTSRYYNYFSSTKNFKVSGNIMSLCYGSNFVGQTTLPWTYTFYYLFRSCTKLVDISNLILPATTLTNYCYSYMFYGCTKLVDVSDLILPATTLINYCYQAMFNGCTSLTTAPELSATTLNTACYMQMFQSCTSLTTAPELPATTLNSACYYYMFYGCTSLTTAPELPATTMKSQCYQQMFYGCTSLTTAPELPATTLESNCYKQMFYNCTSLNYVKALFTTDISSSTSYTLDWLYNVAATGTFIKGQSATWSRTDASGIPSGWTVKIDGAPEDYATIKLYCNYNSGTTYNKHVVSTGSNTTANNNLSEPLKPNRKYTNITNNQANYSETQAFDYVIYGFSQFYLELYCTQTSYQIKYISLHPLNGGTTLYGWGNQKQGLIYASNSNSYGHYYSFDNLDPTKKYHIRVEVMMNGIASYKHTASVYIPYIYPTQTIETGYFTSSQDYTDIYGS